MEKIQYEQFKEIYLQKIKELLKQRGYVNQLRIIGEGLSFEKITLDLGDKVCLCIDLEEVYSAYGKNDYPVFRIAKNTLEYFRNIGVIQRDQVETIENVLVCVTNLKKSKNILENGGIPYLTIDDMAVYFRFNYERRFLGTMESMVSNDHLKNWNYSVEELFSIAKQSEAQEIGACVFNWVEFPQKFGHIPVVAKREDICKEPYDLYGLNGAGAMFYPKVLKQFEEAFHDRIIIIPYSERKVALVAENQMQETWVQKALRDNIVNTETRLSLSRHVYLYDRGRLKKLKDIPEQMRSAMGQHTTKTMNYEKKAIQKR